VYKLYLIWCKCHSACYWALPVANLILIQFSAKLDSKKHCSNAKTNIFGVFTDSLERCPHPGIPINGYLLTTSNFTVGSIAEFSCQPGFTLIGHKRQECLFFLQWSGGGAPQCTSELLFCHQFLSFSFSGYQTFPIAYHLSVPYCRHVTPCSRKTQSSKYYSIKSLENQNWHNFDMSKMSVRICGHFWSQQVHKNSGIY